MGQRVKFSLVKTKLSRFIGDEGIILPRGYLNCLLKFLSKACIYEEEGREIKPNILIGNNIIESNILTMVTNKYILPIKKGKKNGSDFEKILKSILPFCINGWYVYIDIQETNIEYGICRAFNGPQGLSLVDIIFDKNIPNSELDYDCGIISIEVISDYEIKMIGLRKNNLLIDFRLIEHDANNLDDIYGEIVTDIISGIDVCHREDLFKVFSKIFKLTFQRVHGTICVVVRADAQIPFELLLDGIWLPDPIKISEYALELIGNTKDIYLDEKYYGLTGLFIEMMNIDGITIIDTKGNIIGYNTFINQAKVKEIKVSGGARKRAAYAILNSGDPNIVGVYFQSQDGHVFYERMIANA